MGYLAHMREIRRQACMCEHDIEARLCNHCGCGKTISITYSECVPIALGIQHAINMCHIVICDLSGYTISLHVIS